MVRSSVRCAAAVVAFATMSACGRNPPASEASRAEAAPAEDVVARVNGVPITRTDVQREARGGGHPGVMPEAEKDVIEGLVRQELAAQRARELRLELAPEARVELARLEAQVAALRRRRLAEAYDKHVAAKAVVSDEEARKYFEAERARIRTEVHVWQILLHDDARIAEARRELEAGVPFEQVARRQFPGLPDSAGPFWDVGYLRWVQVPAQWRSALDGLEEGQTSGVIQGPKNRRWILKLIDRRENPDITFELVKPMIVETLRSARVEAARADAERALRSGARVVYTDAGPPAK